MLGLGRIYGATDYKVRKTAEANSCICVSCSLNENWTSLKSIEPKGRETGLGLLSSGLETCEKPLNIV